VAQFAQFVQAGYGDDAVRWWTPEGWRWKQQHAHMHPLSWDDSHYNATNQPIAGVTWYEAVAFCAWLTEHVDDTLPTGWVVRLPTEAEWEAAVAYDARRQRST